VQTGPPLHEVAGVQIAPTHESLVGQTTPHPPQFFGSVSMLVQPVGQHC
jgi:hypothetical protein